VPPALTGRLVVLRGLLGQDHRRRRDRRGRTRTRAGDGAGAAPPAGHHRHCGWRRRRGG
jgi:hypothetical protein